MIKEETTKLIEEMQEVKAAHTSLSVSDVLKLFEIKAMKELTIQLMRIGR